MTKSELLNWLQEEYQRWERLLEPIGPDRIDQPGINGYWSLKDIVAHLTGWNRWLVLRLQAAGRGEPKPPHPTCTAPNARFAKQIGCKCGRRICKQRMISIHGAMGSIAGALRAK
jgi:hypothetical protein